MLQQVEYYKYLGNSINQGSKCIIEIKSRIAQAKSAFMNKKNVYAPIALERG